MLKISDYSSLDERLAAGPPVDALCDNCRRLKLLELFSGPRYDDFGDGHEHPVLDVFVGTVEECRNAAEQCRFCFLVSAFHDAKHTDPSPGEKVCKGDLERCFLKPYRTDAVLGMKDESNDSDKESIATSVNLIFEDGVDVPVSRRIANERSRDTSGGGSQHGIISRTIKSLSQKLQQNDVAAEDKHPSQVTRYSMMDAPHQDDDSRGPVSPTEYPGQGSRTSTTGMHKINFQADELPKHAYAHHRCLFCLPTTSAIGRRRTLSFSKTARGPGIDWPSLRAWIEACEREHPACQPKRGDLSVEEEFSIRCIDVKLSTIVPISPHTRYLALSYVWGTAHSELTGHIIRCVIGNNATIMTETLPSTVRDAIRITEQLGERYLWVDCICLDQSDAATIAEQIGIMDRIYENAILTLVTSTSHDVYSEIRGLRDHSRLRSVSEVRVEGQIIKAVCATSVELDFRGVWQHRGWTFQEWILSKRCLFFSNSQILFRCQELSGLESFQPPRNALSTSAVIPKFWADSQAAATIMPRLSLDSQTWQFHTYAGLVYEYTKRRLAYISDVFHAFTGIMRKLERSSGMAFVEGLPVGDLLKALLWSSNTNISQKDRRPEIPSWTWAGWSCSARYQCWESDELSDEDWLLPKKHFRFVDWKSPHAKRRSTLSFKSHKKPQIPVILSTRLKYEDLYGPPNHRAFRLRSAKVDILSESKNLSKSCLRIVSETRSALVHHKPPEDPAKPRIYWGRHEDDLLHPVTREVIAGLNCSDFDLESRKLLSFHFGIEVSSGQSFSSYHALLLYEWDIAGKEGRWHQKVVAMIVNRLGDATVERVTLVSMRSKDWYGLPLVSEHEDVVLV
jgi:Heterokaryon incompatibility protein (HET)